MAYTTNKLQMADSCLTCPMRQAGFFCDFSPNSLRLLGGRKRTWSKCLCSERTLHDDRGNNNSMPGEFHPA